MPPEPTPPPAPAPEPAATPPEPQPPAPAPGPPEPGPPDTTPHTPVTWDQHKAVVEESKDRKATIRSQRAELVDLRGQLAAAQGSAAAAPPPVDPRDERIARLELRGELGQLTDGATMDGATPKPRRTSDKILDLMVTDALKVQASEGTMSATELDTFARSWALDNAWGFRSEDTTPAPTPAALLGQAARQRPVPAIETDASQQQAWERMSAEEQGALEKEKPGTTSRMIRLTSQSIVEQKNREGL